MVYLGLPIKNGWIFHGELLNNQRVHIIVELRTPAPPVGSGEGKREGDVI